MMSKFCRAILIAVVALAWSCASSPNLPGGKYSSGKITIADLKSLYQRSPFHIDRECYIEGRIISSDACGNFYKTLVVEDETGGVAIRIDLNNYHYTYKLYSKIRVNCNSLVLSEYGGAIQLGAYDSAIDRGSIGYIPAGNLESVIVKRGDGTPPVFRTVKIENCTSELIYTMAVFENVSFIDEETGLSWADPAAETDADRHIRDGDGNTLIVRTSRFATFAEEILPEGNIRISGVISYFNGNYQLVLTSSNSFSVQD